jgi:hypothetical protein
MSAMPIHCLIQNHNSFLFPGFLRNQITKTTRDSNSNTKQQQQQQQKPTKVTSSKTHSTTKSPDNSKPQLGIRKNVPHMQYKKDPQKPYQICLEIFWESQSSMGNRFQERNIREPSWMPKKEGYQRKIKKCNQ